MLDGILAEKNCRPHVDQPKREKCVIVNKAGSRWSFEECFNIRHGDIELVVCPAGFRSCVGPAFPYCAPFPTLWRGNVCHVPLYVESS